MFRENVLAQSPGVSNSKKAAWPLKMGPICCLELSVTNYQPAPCNIPEEQRPLFVKFYKKFGHILYVALPNSVQFL